MIYICEYDGTIERQTLLAAAAYLPIEPEVKFAAAAESKDRAEKMAKVRWEKGRERILAWMLLEYALRNECGYSLAELQIARTEKGKPYSVAHPEIRFNLSHCGSACACIVSLEECGIDIERKFPYRESLAKKICCAKEWKILSELSQSTCAGAPFSDKRSEMKECQLQILWSLKESFVKKNGQGLGYGMDRVSFAELMPFPGMGVSAEHSVLWAWRESYTMAACLSRKDFAAGDLASGDGPVIYSVSERTLQQ